MRRIVVARMGLGLVLALLFFATIGALVFLQFLLAANAPDVGAEEVTVTVLRRDGSQRFFGTLLVEPPTALGALQAAGKAAAFDVQVVAYPNGRYVSAIGDESAEGVGGWVYRVAQGNATATYPNAAADRVTLATGDRVTWHWTDEPVVDRPRTMAKGWDGTGAVLALRP